MDGFRCGCIGAEGEALAQQVEDAAALLDAEFGKVSMKAYACCFEM